MVSRPAPEGRSASETVPFRLAGRANPLILVPVHVNEQGPFAFILDTGASHCLLSPELAGTLALPLEGETDAAGACGSVKLALSHAASMAVGSVRRDAIEVAITDELKRIGTFIGSRVDGDLGFGFLQHFAVTIDYQARVLCLAPGSEGSNGSPSRNPFRLADASNPLILVQVLVNDQGPFEFVLDTGTSRTMLSSELAAKMAIETSDDSPAAGGGLGGKIEIVKGKLRSLAVGNAVVREHAIGAGDFLAMLSDAVGTKLDGIIGYNFLKEFRVTIDYPGKIVDLKRAAPE
jgi:predicted aspartyl protease